MSVIAYITREFDQFFLNVMDDSSNTFHKYPLDAKGLARLSAESARAVNSSFGGYDAVKL